MSVFRNPNRPESLAVARGHVGGAYSVNSFGELVTTGTVRSNQLIWPLNGSPLFVPDVAGVTVTVTSSSDQDAAGGTGIQALVTHYLDGSLNQQSLAIVPTGTTPLVTTIADCRFIQCTHGVAFGGGGTAVGNISLTGGGGTLSYIKAGSRRCSSSARRVPAGKRMIIDAMWASSISGTSATNAIVRFATTLIDSYDLTESAITFPHMSIGGQDSSVALSGLAILVPEGVVACLEADVENKAATITAGFSGWIEDA